MAPFDGDPRSTRITPRVLSVIAVAVLVLGIAVPGARAESFTDACGGANNLDPATCERVDYLVTQEDDTQRVLSWVLGVITFGVTLPVWRGVFRG